MKFNLRSETWRGLVTEVTPWQRRWIKRGLVFLAVSMLLSQTPLLLCSVMGFLLGTWRVPQRLVARLYAARRLRLKRRPRAQVV